MSWLNRVRNSLSSLSIRRGAAVPDNLWIKCKSCSEMLFTKDYEANLSVCPLCGNHGRIGADARLSQLLDPGFALLADPRVREDPLKFRDSKKYPERLKAARAATPHNDNVVVFFRLGVTPGHRPVLVAFEGLFGKRKNGIFHTATMPS